MKETDKHVLNGMDLINKNIKGINKVVLYAGSSYVELQKDAKAYFHFQTRINDENNTLIDDSRKLGSPMQLILGRKFKLPVWESLICHMALNEVAKFTVNKSLVTDYPFMMKIFRDTITKPNNKKPHCCHGIAVAEGTGYSDLDTLIQNPRDLEFTIELIKVELSGEYSKECWQLSDDEKYHLITTIKEEGNDVYKQKDYSMAIDKYKYALEYLEQLLLKEKPHDQEWNELMKVKCTLLLNCAQCKFKMKEYYEVIRYCDEVLEIQPENVKALYRRANAHSEAWNKKEAMEDFQKVALYDPSLKSTVCAHLAKISNKNIQYN